jgi:hypothetical protein
VAAGAVVDVAVLPAEAAAVVVAVAAEPQVLEAPAVVEEVKQDA